MLQTRQEIVSGAMVAGSVLQVSTADGGQVEVIFIAYCPASNQMVTVSNGTKCDVTLDDRVVVRFTGAVASCPHPSGQHYSLQQLHGLFSFSPDAVTAAPQ